MPTINTIKDTRVRVKASSELIDILKDNKARLNQVPKEISQTFQSLGINLPNANEKENCSEKKKTCNGINLNLLNDILSQNATLEITAEINEKPKPKTNNETLELYLYLNDVLWLSQFLSSLRAESIVDVYLNDLLETCDLELPQNELIERNPVLEARCQKLREEQQNREYRKMTKNVDATLKHYPEDTIAYQMNAMNSQIIAVLQFIFSVAAGFAFGFIGIELIIGNLDFGLRLLLGVMMALIIALAEIYFLAKKLNEYDDTVDTVNRAIQKTIPTKVKEEKKAKSKSKPKEKPHKD